MPPRGVKSAKRERQYEHIKASAKQRGAGTDRAEEIAARTVNKQRSEAGETRTASKGAAKKRTAKKRTATKRTAKKSSASARTATKRTAKTATRKVASKKR